MEALTHGWAHGCASYLSHHRVTDLAGHLHECNLTEDTATSSTGRPSASSVKERTTSWLFTSLGSLAKTGEARLVLPESRPPRPVQSHHSCATRQLAAGVEAPVQLRETMFRFARAVTLYGGLLDRLESAAMCNVEFRTNVRPRNLAGATADRRPFRPAPGLRW